MRHALVVLMLLASACSRATPTASPPLASSSPTPPVESSPAVSHTTVTAVAPVTSDRWVGVSVATVWTLPSSPRSIDAPALAAPPRLREWLTHMTDDQKRALVGRVQTQVLYGQRVIVIETSGTWSHVAVPSQPSQKDGRGYPGWIPTAQLTTAQLRGSRFVRVTAPTTWATDPTTHERLIELSYGTALPISGDNVRLFARREAGLPASDTVEPRDVITEARKFLGLPYLWGGTSGYGYDCSGFTYSIYGALGIKLARDTDQQIHNGRAVPLSSVVPGDLLFVANASGAVVHEAMYYGVENGTRSIIEAPRTGVPIHIVPMSTHSYVAARRVLG